MITVDIISPGGAFTPAATGNTQELTANFSITSGTATLTCTSATPFVSGDTGKYFIIKGPGSGGPTSTWLVGTMTFVSSSQVTLSLNATKTITDQSCYIAWGADDAPAFRAFNTWAQAQSDSITLTLGSGAKNFLFATSDPTSSIRGGSIVWNIPHPVTIQGNGSSTTKFIQTGVFQSFHMGAPNYLKSGNGTYPATSSYTARLASVDAGSSSLTCLTTADAALFTSNTYALISGLDLMGTGQPPNAYLYEYVYMTDVDTDTGVITLQSPLGNSYLSTWPDVNSGTPGSEPDQGGPATLYVLDPGWNIDATFRGIGLNSDAAGQASNKCRKIVFDDIKVYDEWGLIPSGGVDAEFIDCDLSSYSMEIDKIHYSAIFDGTTTGQLVFQSSVNEVIVRNGSNITGGFNGTPRTLSITDSTVNGLGLGSIAFGHSERFTTSGSTYTGEFNYFGVEDTGDNTHTGIQVDYTMSGGVIRMPRASRDYAGLRWAVPGCKFYFTGTNGSSQAAAWPIITVQSVTADANYIYVTTDWRYGGFPEFAGRIEVLPSSYMSFASDTVSSVGDFQILKAQTAAGITTPASYQTKTFNGGNLGNDSAEVTLTPITYGRLVSLTVDVTTPYTGFFNPLSWRTTGIQRGVITENGGAISNYRPFFDLRTAGRRVITPSGVTGFGSDSALALNNPSDTWFNNLLAGWGASQNITSEYNSDPSVGPVFTVELILDQGLPAVSPLSLRLHA